METAEKRHLFLIAGEPSGDVLGARLMRALRNKNPGIIFSGIGGDEMQAQGLKTLFPMQELSIMGLAEVLPRLPGLLRRINQTVASVLSINPQALITIDSPDFCLRVARKIKAKAPQISCIHYVAPTVWAWRPGRAKKMAKYLDHVLALFPFEPPYFEKEGLSCDFAGHPLTEKTEIYGDGRAFRARHGLSERQPVLALLPGSRAGEISRLLPDFLQTAQQIRQKIPDLAIAIPTLPHLESSIRSQAADDIIITTTAQEKHDIFAVAEGALAASGTVTLELALAGVPSVLAYKASPLTAWLGRRLIRLSHVGLVSILLGRTVVPEFLQQDCMPENLSKALLPLFEDAKEAQAQKDDLKQAAALLRVPGDMQPSELAASIVMNIIERKKANA